MAGTLRIQGVRVDNITYAELAGELDGYLLRREKKCIGFVNAHCVNTALEDREYREILEHFDLVLPDGIGVFMASVLRGSPIRENLNGTDLLPRIFKGTRLGDASLFLFGGRPGVAFIAGEKLKKICPGLRIAGYMHGYIAEEGSEEAALIDAVNRSGADIVLVGTGVPRQEKWISRNRHRLNAVMLIGVGAFMDFMSGSVKRAPVWVRRTGFEWLYRFIQEPRRLWKRYTLEIFSFLWRELRGGR